MNRLKNRDSFSAVALLCAAALSGCGVQVAPASKDTSGHGNEFTVHGEVTAVGQHSVVLAITKTESAQGAAKDWFGEGQLHQVYSHDEDCVQTDTQAVSTETNQAGGKEELSDVSVGEEIELQGTIQYSSAACGTSENPAFVSVYDQLIGTG